ncbi:MAG TPA: hypothetical protein ENJ53_02840 [Phaeodactylibacter sp.]|nr:hypothetical protein [Phaeodactylibacter sp.]
MNNLKSLFIFFICCVSFFVSAQQLHTPQEVVQYMEQSTVEYVIDSSVVTLDSVVLPMVEKGYFLEKSKMGNQLQKKNFPLSKKSKKYLKKAQKAADQNDFSKTIKYYKKALNATPNHPAIINDLASVYWTNGKMEEVVFWAKKGVELNPIDFESHARLALAYLYLGKNKKALEHILLAHLYNRNHPKVIKILKKVFAKNGMNYQDYFFQPKYNIEVNDSTKIIIHAHQLPWMAYARCKALWQNDENYKKEMSQLANVSIATIEQKECLLNALIGYRQMKTGKENYPLLGVLGKAMRKKMVNDFIFYEIELRQDPMMIYLVPQKKINRIIEYLTTVRVN